MLDSFKKNMYLDQIKFTFYTNKLIMYFFQRANSNGGIGIIVHCVLYENVKLCAPTFKFVALAYGVFLMTIIACM